MNFHTLSIIWQNMTSPKRRMPKMPWDGQELLHIPYAAMSPSQYLDLYLPNTSGKKPLLVLVHGGGFLYGDSQTRQMEWMYRHFRQQGYACASINYRLAQEAPWPAAIEDVKAAVRFLRANAVRFGIDADRFALWGESAGGYLAAMAAVTDDDTFVGVPYVHRGNAETSSKAQVLVDFYGLADLGDKSDDFRQMGIPRWVVRWANSWLNAPELKASGFTRVEDYFIRKQFSTLSAAEASAYTPISYMKQLDKDSLKVILVHGEADITVPVQQTRKKEAAFAARLGRENVFALYPRLCKHADDRLYEDSLLTVVREKLDYFLR